MTPPRTPAPAARGFTLLELLLAMVVFAIVITAINSVFFTGMRVRNTVTAAIERTEPLERTLIIIKQDLQNLVLPGGTMTGTLQTTPLGSNMSTNGSSMPTAAQQSAMLSQNPSGMPGQSTPLFYTANGLVDETSPWANLEQVYYFLRTPTNNIPGMDLYRAVTANLLQIVPEQCSQQYLMSGVDSINCYFFAQSTGQAGQWLQFWDSTNPDQGTLQTNNVPRAIKFEIQLISASRGYGRSVPVELVVPISVQASTNQSTGYAP